MTEMGHPRRSVLVLSVLAACGADPPATIEVLGGGPLVQVTEGEPATRRLRVTPDVPVEFRIVDGEAGALVDHAIEATGAGEATLTITPRCDAIPRDRTLTTATTLEVIADGADAAPVTITIEIRPSTEGACAPVVAGWIGDCAVRAPVAGELIVPLVETAQTLCVEIALPDADVRRLTVSAAASATGLLDPAGLVSFEIDNLAGPGETFRHTHAIAIPSAARDFRGRMMLALEWDLDGPARAELALVVGAPGDGVVRIDARVLAGLVATEFAISVVPFDVSYYAQTGRQPCARIRPTPAVEQAAILRSALGVVVRPGALACGAEAFTFDFQPRIDALPVELVELEAWSCSAELADCERLAERSVPVAVASVAEHGIAMAAASDRACVDLDGDGAPELAIVGGEGAAAATTISTTLGDRVSTLAQLDRAIGLFGFRWYDAAADRAVPVLLGEHTSPPVVRRATPTAWDPDPIWERLTDVADRDETSRWVALGPTRAHGATYIAMRSGQSEVVLVCVSTACSGDHAIDLSTASVPPPVIAAIAAADVDGDGTADLVVALDSGAQAFASKPLRLSSLALTWSGARITQIGEPVPLGEITSLLGWSELSLVALPSPAPPPGLAARERIYGVVSGAQRELVELAPCRVDCETPYAGGVVDSTPPKAHGLAELAGRLVVSSDIGVWEYRLAADDKPGSWILRDPQLALESTLHELPIPRPSYGAGLRACILEAPTARPSIVFNDRATAGLWTLLDVQVDRLQGAVPP